LLQFNLHREEHNFQHFIKTIQISLASNAKNIFAGDFKKMISIHAIVPILYGPFLAMLLQSYPLLLAQNSITLSDTDQNVFNLNISQLDREVFEMPEVV
jgi:hypothetical protein